MSLTQERINKIANESALTVMRELGYPEEQFITAHVAQRIVNLSLSRIREEQKAVAWVSPLRYGSQVTFYKPVKPYDDDEEPWYCYPLFTIQPAAPDCKELVEALEIIRKGDDSPRTIAMVALAKHKASMGEKE